MGKQGLCLRKVTPSVLPLVATARMATGPYADYFDHSGTSDVKVVIEVADSAGDHPRRQLSLRKFSQSSITGDICAHSVILMSNSPVWKVWIP